MSILVYLLCKVIVYLANFSDYSSSFSFSLFCTGFLCLNTVICSLIPDLGVEKGIKLEGMTEPQISKVLEDMVKAGEAFKA